MRFGRLVLPLLVAAAAGLRPAAQSQVSPAQPAPAAMQEWPVYGGDAGGQKFSPP